MVAVKYTQSFGKCDGGPECEYDLELTPNEEKIYDKEIEKIKKNKAKEEEIDISEVELCDEDLDSINSHPKLQDALERARKEILDFEAEEYGNEDILRDRGQVEMDEDKLCELVTKRDPHAIKFFHLENATDEELEEWSPDELPLVCDFVKNFKPEDTVEISVWFATDPY